MPTESAAQLRGLDAVSRRVAWASGSEGTVLRTLNSGQEWDSVGPPGTSALEFRDIEAIGRKRALILSIGTGDDSRITEPTTAGRPGGWCSTSKSPMPSTIAWPSSTHARVWP